MSYLGLHDVLSLKLRTENPVVVRMNVPELCSSHILPNLLLVIISE